MTEVLLQNGRPKGSGIVRFEMFESADKAVGEYKCVRRVPEIASIASGLKHLSTMLC